MDKKESLSRIIFLIREMEYTRERLKMAGPHALEIEIALLNQQVLSLYNQLQHYNRLGWEQAPVHSQASPTSPASPPPPSPAIKIPIIEKAETKESAESVKPKEAQSKPVTEYKQPQNIPDNSSKTEATGNDKKESNSEGSSLKEVQKAEENKKAEPRPVLPDVNGSNGIEIKKSPSIGQQSEIASVYAKAREKAAQMQAEKPAAIKMEPPTTRDREVKTSVELPKRALSDKAKLTPVNDLRTAISINQRIAFTNQLFKGDDKEFRRVISFLNNCSNFAEARMYLQSEIAPAFHWDMENPLVEDLIELTYRKFI